MLLECLRSCDSVKSGCGTNESSESSCTASISSAPVSMTVDEEHLEQPKCDHHAQNRSAVLHSAVYGGPQTQQPEEADETDLGPGEEPAPLTEAFCPPERSWTSMPSWTSSIRRTSERACSWEWTFSWEQTCSVAVLASQAEHREARLAG